MRIAALLLILLSLASATYANLCAACVLNSNVTIEAGANVAQCTLVVLHTFSDVLR